MERPLVLVGGGGHCKSVIEAAESVGYTIKGILDIPENVGKKVLDFEVIGTDDDISFFVNECDFIITLGFIKNPHVRNSLYERVEVEGGRLITLIASTAHVSKYTEIGPGSVILHQACVNADAKIGKGCIINTFANIEHDVKIGDFCHIATGSMINGDCKVGKNSFIGSQSVLANGITICDNVIVGAGSFIRKDILYPGTYSGNSTTIML